MRRRGGEDGLTPPVACAERHQRTEDHAERDRAAEQRAARNGFDDLEVAETAGHVNRADGPVDEQEIPGDPGDRDKQDDGGEQPGERAGGDQRLAACEGPVPCTLRCFDGQPAAAKERHYQKSGADQVQLAPGLPGHAVTPRAASQFSTSAR